MFDLIVSVLDHFLSFYFRNMTMFAIGTWLQKP